MYPPYKSVITINFNYYYYGINKFVKLLFKICNGYGNQLQTTETN